MVSDACRQPQVLGVGQGSRRWKGSEQGDHRTPPSPALTVVLRSLIVMKRLPMRASCCYQHSSPKSLLVVPRWSRWNVKGPSHPNSSHYSQSYRISCQRPAISRRGSELRHGRADHNPCLSHRTPFCQLVVNKQCLCSQFICVCLLAPLHASQLSQLHRRPQSPATTAHWLAVPQEAIESVQQCPHHSTVFRSA